MSTDLFDQARELLTQAERVFAGLAPQQELIEARNRLDEPLRVAIAGKVKAGKSTLLNALVGERVAPTDTGECTKIVTWYQNGHTFQVMIHPVDGTSPVQATFHRDDGSIEVDLAGRAPTDIEKLEVTWPTRSLERITLIDTPGVDTLSTEIAAKAHEFLDPKDTDTPADAVLYLMKHIHTSDVRLLEAFHDEAVSQPNPVNAIAVLSRADEIAGGRVDAMASAKRIATRYSDDSNLRRLVQMVIPVAGLLAETARTITETEFQALRELAAIPRKDVETLLLSADRFVRATPETPLTEDERLHLLQRLGIFGIRQSMVLLRAKKANNSVELADELVKRSGLVDLQTVLNTLFVDRATVLKTRSALLTVERICEEYRSHPGTKDLLIAIERIMAEAHAFNELDMLAEIRSGRIGGRRQDLRALEQVLGAGGTTPWQRLGLSSDADREELRSTAIGQRQKWSRVAESPLTTKELETAVRVAVRSIEGVLADLPATVL